MTANLSRAGGVRATPMAKWGRRPRHKSTEETEAFAEGAQALGGGLVHARGESPEAQDVWPLL